MADEKNEAQEPDMEEACFQIISTVGCAKSNFIDAIQKIDEIVECYNISGDYDFMLKILVSSMSHYQEFVQNKLGVIESIGSLHSLFVLKEMKHTHGIKLPD